MSDTVSVRFQGDGMRLVAAGEDGVAGREQRPSSGSRRVCRSFEEASQRDEEKERSILSDDGETVCGSGIRSFCCGCCLLPFQ